MLVCVINGKVKKVKLNKRQKLAFEMFKCFGYYIFCCLAFLSFFLGGLEEVKESHLIETFLNFIISSIIVIPLVYSFEKGYRLFKKLWGENEERN